MTSQRDWSALPNVEKFPETALMEKFERRPVSGFLKKKSFLKTPGGSGGLFFFFFSVYCDYMYMYRQGLAHWHTLPDAAYLQVPALSLGVDRFLKTCRSD